MSQVLAPDRTEYYCVSQFNDILEFFPRSTVQLLHAMVTKLRINEKENDDDDDDDDEFFIRSYCQL